MKKSFKKQLEDADKVLASREETLAQGLARINEEETALTAYYDRLAQLYADDAEKLAEFEAKKNKTQEDAADRRVQLQFEEFSKRFSQIQNFAEQYINQIAQLNSAITAVEVNRINRDIEILDAESEARLTKLREDFERQKALLEGGAEDRETVLRRQIEDLKRNNEIELAEEKQKELDLILLQKNFNKAVEGRAKGCC